MVVKLGKVSECAFLSSSLPKNVLAFLERNIGVLDEAYGLHRNYYKEGGYIIYADDRDGIQHARVTIASSLYEWIKHIDGYAIELHLLGDDFAVLFCYPVETRGE